MEQVKTETSTKAIPAQVILAWKLYADHLASVESMLPNRPRLDVPVLYPPDTVTGKIARPISTWLMGCAHTAGSLHFLPTSFGLINNFEKASTISV
ncbi:MAG: hypothetical protein Q7R68_09400, partial [Nitrospirales bacterium]|nr:hypothetical protein [Nitrospirales bacterium]